MINGMLVRQHWNTKCTGTNSLRSKRFHRVWEQRKTEEWDFRCFSHAKNGARAKKKMKEGVKGGNEGNACRQTPGF